jgi:hypothetical protein
LGGSAEFDGTLVSVLQHRPPKSEVIVAHTAPYEDPYRLADEVDFLHCPEAMSLVGLINVALEAAASPIIHVLTCGLEATEGWTDAAAKLLADDEIAAVAPAVMNVDDEQLLSAGVRLTSAGSRTVLRDQRLLAGGSGQMRATIGAPTLAAGFYRRDVLDVIGGFDLAAGDGFADVDLAVKLRALELRTVLEPAARLVQTADPLARSTSGALARGRTSERLFWRSSPDMAWPLAMALHTFAALADPAAIAGRLVALLEIGSAARHREKLAEAAGRLARLRSSKAQVKPTFAPAATRRLAA